MLNLNRAMIIGNVTRDIEIRYTPGGQPVSSFSVATNRRWVDSTGNNQEETEFHDVVAWGKLAEIASQVLAKGRKVYVEGRLKTRNWEGQDGVKRYKTEIIADNLIALDRPAGESSFNAHAEAPNTNANVQDFPVDDVTPQDEEEKKEKPVKKEKQDNEEKPADDGDINLDDIPF